MSSSRVLVALMVVGVGMCLWNSANGQGCADGDEIFELKNEVSHLHYRYLILNII